MLQRRKISTGTRRGRSEVLAAKALSGNLAGAVVRKPITRGHELDRMGPIGEARLADYFEHLDPVVTREEIASGAEQSLRSPIMFPTVRRPRWPRGDRA